MVKKTKPSKHRRSPLTEKQNLLINATPKQITLLSLCLSVVSLTLSPFSRLLSLPPFSIFQLAKQTNQKKGEKKKKKKLRKKKRNRVNRTRCDTTFRGRASAPTTTFVHAPTQSRCSNNVLEGTNNQARHETRNKEIYF
jgi:hypothetical protein